MRSVIAGLPASKIREVANAGLGRSDVLAFWFGESDEATPAVVKEAAMASLQAGETFYSHNLGLPELREALAAYLGDLHGAVAAERIAVTSSGVSALMIASEVSISGSPHMTKVTNAERPSFFRLANVWSIRVVTSALSESRIPAECPCRRDPTG